MKFRGLLSAAVCLLLPAGVSAQDYVPGELLVKLARASDLSAVLATHRVEAVAQFGSRPIYRLAIGDGSAPPEKATAMRDDARVVLAEPNYEHGTPEGSKDGSWVIGNSVREFAGQWAPGAIRLREAHVRTRGAGVTVAVLDTGIDTAHEAFSGRLVPGYDFVDDDADPREEGGVGDRGYGHGTHVAGLVALAAPEASIMPLRVLDRAGRGNAWVLAEALLYAVDPDGDPTTDDGAGVVNLSLGTRQRTRFLEDIVARAACRISPDSGEDDADEDAVRCSLSPGAIVVAAAGNSGDATAFYPAAEAGALAVAATTPSGALASFSTRGPWIALAAPGESIIGPVPGGWATWSGTSMAAPLAAGVAALVRSREPGIRPDAAIARLALAARPLQDLAFGLLDAEAAVGALELKPAPFMQTTAQLAAACASSPGHRLLVLQPIQLTAGSTPASPQKVATGCTLFLAGEGSLHLDKVGLRFAGPFAIVGAARSHVSLAGSRLDATSVRIDLPYADSSVTLDESRVLASAGNLRIDLGPQGAVAIAKRWSGSSLNAAGTLRLSARGKAGLTASQAALHAGDDLEIELGDAEGSVVIDESVLRASRKVAVDSGAGGKSEMKHGSLTGGLAARVSTGAGGQCMVVGTVSKAPLLELCR